jgi:hypothetical protein
LFFVLRGRGGGGGRREELEERLKEKRRKYEKQLLNFTPTQLKETRARRK